MNCTLCFYKLPVNLDGKNFVLESIENYLGTFTPLTISNFQYQRMELDKTIKVNLSQDYQLDINAITKYNYLKIIAKDENNRTSNYYYFIKKPRQLSMGTIEFEIHMDALNTFRFSSTASNNTYTLSPKSLITREHKDRFTHIEKTNVTREATEAEIIDIADIIYEGSYLFTSESAIYAFPKRILYERILQYGYVRFINNVGTTYGIKVNGTLCAGVIFNNSEISLIDENGDEMGLISWGNLEGYIGVQFIDINNTIIVDGLDTWTHTLVFFNLENPDFEAAVANCIVRNVFGGSANVLRSIDYFQEGINPLLFKTSEEKLIDFDGDYTWYVIYSSVSGVVSSPSDTEPKYVNPVQVDIMCDANIEFSTTSARSVAVYATQIPQVNDNQEYLIFPKSLFTGSNKVVIGSITIDASDSRWNDYDYLLIRKKNNNDIVFADAFFAGLNNTGYIFGDRSAAFVTNFTYFSAYGINEVQVGWGVNVDNIYTTPYKGFVIGSSSQQGNTLDNINDIDLSDPKLIKIINIPYCPVSWINSVVKIETLSDNYEYNSEWNTLKAKKPQILDFDRDLELDNTTDSPFNKLYTTIANISKTAPRNKNYESKLFNSDYRVDKFVYDSFGFYFKLEDIDIEKLLEQTSFEPFIVNFKVSGNFQSKFMFTFPQYICRKTTEDYEKILIVERNNEKALFNNAYINYMRNGGYSYDTKKATAQNAMNGITTAFTILGAAGSFASTPVTGIKGIVAGVSLATTSVASIIRSIHTAQEQDRAIAQKSLQLQNQGTSVSGSEDIDLLRAFSGNKAKLAHYKCSDVMENAMWDLFHYCGYATHEQKIPDVTTRCNFNFVQGDVILKDYTFNDDIAKEIVNRWKEGITFMHIENNNYDLEQQYENLETSLF